MYYIKHLYHFYKNNMLILQPVKITALIIINVWLLIIFWKILLIENINIIENNIILTKMQTKMQPFLQILGLDILNPNTLKMVTLTIIVLFVNITIVHFNAIMLMVIPLGLARYMYKMYTNYLINITNKVVEIPQVAEVEKPAIKSETLVSPEVIKVVEEVPQVINNGTNWWLWGTVIAVGLISIAGIIFIIYSNNSNANNIANITEFNIEVNDRLKDEITYIKHQTDSLHHEIENLNYICTKHGSSIEGLSKQTSWLNKDIIKLNNEYEELHKNVQDTVSLAKETNKFVSEVSEATSLSELLIISVTQLTEGFQVLTQKVTELELANNPIQTDVPEVPTVIDKNAK